MELGHKQLEIVADSLKGNNQPQAISVRDFLFWFGAERRGYWIVHGIREALIKYKLETEPDFESAYIDSQISFRLVGESSKVPDTSILSDPTYRVSKLAAANQPITSVNPNSTIEEVVTLMLERDFSQIPVMSNEREVKGMVTWRGIGSRLSLGRRRATAKEYMEAYYEVRSSDSLFGVIDKIVEFEHVLVRDSESIITGIITASDLSVQFRILSEAFLLLSEIENLVRNMIDDRFTVEEILECVEEGDGSREIGGVADLNFGEYIRLLENRDRWEKFGIAIDRKTFCKGLDQVRRIRNDVMHFDPDGIPDDDLERLRDYTKFLSVLKSVADDELSNA